MQLHNKVGTGTEFSDKRRTFPVFLDRAGNLLTETELAMARTYDEELKFLEKVSSTGWRIKKGFVPNMKVMSQSCRPHPGFSLFAIICSLLSFYRVVFLSLISDVMQFSY
jgi:hypothetical protein